MKYYFKVIFVSFLFVSFLFFFNQCENKHWNKKCVIQHNGRKYRFATSPKITFVQIYHVNKELLNNLSRKKYSIKNEWKIYNNEFMKNKIVDIEEKKLGSSEELDNTFLCKKGNVLNKEKKEILKQIFTKKGNNKWYDFKFFSPAKINLFLRLKEKKNTYNELSTLMHSINLGDDIFIKALDTDEQKKLSNFFYPCITGDFLTIEKEEKKRKKKKNDIEKEKQRERERENEREKEREGERKKEKKIELELEIEQKNVNNWDCYNNYPLNEKNIIIKVLKKYRDTFQIRDKTKFLIHIKKRIPIFSGLGGGSSNGATIFYFLENHYYKNIINDKLKKYSLLEEIGSDISFFDSSGFAYCMGKGNEVIDLKQCSLNALKNNTIYLFQINEGLSSQLVYDHVNYKNIIYYNPIMLLKKLANCNDSIIKNIEIKEKKHMKSFINLDNNVELQDLLINDLEAPAFFLKEKLKLMKKILINQNIFKAVSMSGSGTTIFAIAKQEIKNWKMQKKKMKQLITQLREILHLEVKIHICEFLSKKEGKWYLPSIISKVVE